MCEPISIGLGILSTVSTINSQKQAAKSQERQQERASAAERTRVQKQMSSMRAQEGAENRAAAIELQRAQVVSYEAFGEAAAIDNGVGGNSIQAIQNEYLRALGNERQGIYQQLAENNIQREYGFDSARSQAEMNLININQPIAQPDYLGAAVGGASMGLSAYSAMDSAGFLAKAPASASASAAKPAFGTSAFNAAPSTYKPWTAPTTLK